MAMRDIQEQIQSPSFRRFRELIDRLDAEREKRSEGVGRGQGRKTYKT
jgi:hypothetical protein